MTSLDWAVLLAYLVGIVALGFLTGRGNRGTLDYFLAGRRMPWWAVGLSVMATQISAITFIGTTGQAYGDGLRFLVVYFGLPFAMVILCATLVPFFYGARVVTAYEYLERRFDARTRTATSLLFLLSRGLSVGVTLYAPALVLAVIFGMPERTTILLMGGATIAYVIYGGNRAVIWTDVAQMAVIWIGIFVCVGVALVQLPAGFGLRDALALAQTAGRLRTISLTPSLTQPYTLWSGLVAGTFLALSYFGCDQSQVQRYLSSRSLTHSRLSLIMTAVLKIPMQFLILLTGVLVFVFYHFHPAPLLWNPAEAARLRALAPAAQVQRLDERYEAAALARREAAWSFARTRATAPQQARERYLAAAGEFDAARRDAIQLVEAQTARPYNDCNYVFPTYVVSHLPRGVAGLVLAVIFAAAMSSISGELNALTAASMVDFVQRFFRLGGGERRALLVSRVITGLWGLFACAVALRAGQLGSAIEIVNRFGSYFYGSILGVFALAVLTPRVGGRGAFLGLLVGMASVATVAATTRVHFLWYNVIGALVVMCVGVLVGRFSSERARAR